MRIKVVPKWMLFLSLVALLLAPAAAGCAPGSDVGGGEDGGSNSTAAAQYQWRIASAWTEKTRNETLQLFTDLVNYYSHGQIDMEFYPDGVLGTHSELFHALQMGDLQMAIFSPYVDIVPGGAVNWVPFTVENYDQAALAYDPIDGPIHKVMIKAWEEVGGYPIFNAALGAYGIANNVRPLKTPEDFANWKFRVSGSAAYVMVMENMGRGTGMTLETIPWADVYNALERGVVDGCWASYGHMVDARIGEVTKYYTELGLGWDANNIVINLDLWNELPADLQDAIQLAGIRAQERDLQAERRNNFVYKEELLATTNIQITELTPEERAVFREKADMPSVWAQEVTPWLEKAYPGENKTQELMDALDYIKSITG